MSVFTVRRLARSTDSLATLRKKFHSSEPLADTLTVARGTCDFEQRQAATSPSDGLACTDLPAVARQDFIGSVVQGVGQPRDVGLRNLKAAEFVHVCASVGVVHARNS